MMMMMTMMIKIFVLMIVYMFIHFNNEIYGNLFDMALF